ncbi:MAG: glycosyltransferase [Tunicatimonas sp.]|uniref:glycosyltransferase n=1 Tax=Tunicatimonas sp. TaxID=1940096 RepID=UPI003C7338E3
MSYPTSSTVLFLSSYPSRECGIATFTQDMIQALSAQFGDAYNFQVCALEEGQKHQRTYPNEVVATLNTESVAECAKLAKEVNADAGIQVVCLQHEFGLFGGDRGDNVMAFLLSVKKPVILTMHTVLPQPPRKLKRLVRDISQHVQQVVVMTQRSATILQSEYGVSNKKMSLIPHGIHLRQQLNPEQLKEKYALEGKKVLSTFGLLSANKGIESALEALAIIKEEAPNVCYLVLGKTHPVVVEQEGEVYRKKLEGKVKSLGLEDNVRFVNQYLSLDKLLDYLSLTDVYLFMSKDPNQAVSGTFTYAMSCGCPVVSTPMAHAQEVLTPDTGALLKSFDDPNEIAEATIRILSDSALQKHMSRNAHYATREAVWPNVAVRYAQLFHQAANPDEVLHYNLPPVTLQHIRRLTTNKGMIQFTQFDQPDVKSGYTLDDNARALIAMCMHYHAFREAKTINLLETYLDFIISCQQKDGTFLNYVDENGSFTAQNLDVNLEDATMRAVWSLGTVVYYQNVLPADLVTKASLALVRSLEVARKVDSPRARAFAIKGLSAYYRIQPDATVLEVIDHLALGLLDKFNGVATEDWLWFEEYLTYANSVLSESMLLAFLATGREEYRQVAYRSFDFLLRCLFIQEDQIKVISNNGWLMKGEECKNGGEQPIDVCYTITALSLFHRVSRRKSYQDKLHAAFHWYLGNNHLKQIIYNPATGGCFDGLEEQYVNQNQGAESTVCYLIARLQIELEYDSINLSRQNYKIMVGQQYSVTRDSHQNRSVA